MKQSDLRLFVGKPSSPPSYCWPKGEGPPEALTLSTSPEQSV